MTERLKNIKSAYRVVVKGLVRDQSGKLLFVQERSDSWDLPGGGLEHGDNRQRPPTYNPDMEYEVR